MSDTDAQLLERFCRLQAEEAFEKLVCRHLDLVFSAALRQVRSRSLAEEVAQCVFSDLAQQARHLAPDTVLSAWLYQVTRRTAIDVVRREARRQAREQVATELLAMNGSDANWPQIEPLLEEAMESLDSKGRAALLLRYFQHKTLLEVGQGLGTSEEAARKRVQRALEQLRRFFARRGVAVGASALALSLSAEGVKAAPLGLVAKLSAAALSSAPVVPIATCAAKTLLMTTLQKTAFTTAIAVATGLAIYEAQQASSFQSRLQTLEQERAPLAKQVAELQDSLSEAKAQLAKAEAQSSQLKSQMQEVLKRSAERAVRSGERKTSSSGLAPVGGPSAMLDERIQRMRQSGQAQLDGRMAALKARLNLSAQQEAAIRGLWNTQMEKGLDTVRQGFAGKISNEEAAAMGAQQTQEVESQIQAMLNPEQAREYAAFQSEDDPKQARIVSDMQLGQLQNILQLDEKQQDAVFSALLQENQAVLTARRSKTDSSADEVLSEQLKRDADGLQSVLSADQLERFRQWQNREMRR